jgi:hypothetical protein
VGNPSAPPTARSGCRVRHDFRQRAKRIGIDAVATPVRSPRANAIAERVIGTLRRECLDHMIVLCPAGVYGATWQQLICACATLLARTTMPWWCAGRSLATPSACRTTEVRTFGPPGVPGDRNVLAASGMQLDLAGSHVVGSSPTGPSVTLTRALRFTSAAAGDTFLVDVAASDDLGHRDDFVQTGEWTVE